MNATTAPLSEAQLWADYTRNRTVENRNRLVEFHLVIARTLAKKLAERIPEGLWDKASLTAEATIGLMRAVEGFDPNRRLKFYTYAHRPIYGAMIDAMRIADFVPRVARRRKEPGPAMVQMPTRSPMYDGRADSFDFENCIPDRDHAEEPGPIDPALLRGLSKQEVSIVRMYFEDDLTMREIGRALSVSESRVSQLMSQILKRLRERTQCTRTA